MRADRNVRPPRILVVIEKSARCMTDFGLVTVEGCRVARARGIDRCQGNIGME